PINAPATKPTIPNIAFRSPPPSLKIILKGQPKNIKEPIITTIPNINLVKGDDPPLDSNSLFFNDSKNAPNTRPIISGLMYCTTSALCNPIPPAVSRKKQAIQKPMFPRFPKCTSRTDIIPTNPPPIIIPLFPFINLSSYVLTYVYLQ